MNQEVNLIITSLKETLWGEPWWGKPVFTILDEFDPDNTNVRPGVHPHSAIDLIYHMLTWSDFCLGRVRKQEITDLQEFERLDWRLIDPQIHGWEESVRDFKQSNEALILELDGRPDDWLSARVDYREYDFRYMLHGLNSHHIYHAAQINYIGKAMG